MNIIVDVRPLVYSGTGNATYLYYILNEIIKLTKTYNWQWIFISNKEIDQNYKNIITQKIIYYVDNKRKGNSIGPFWYHIRVPQIIKYFKGDIFWGSLFLLPYNIKKKSSVINLLNIHDLNAWIAPYTMKYWNQIYLKSFTKNSLKNADEILCLSNTTKELLIKIFPELINSQHPKLNVVYPGISDIPKSKKKIDILENKKYFLCVGTLEPRKNFHTLIEAYILAKKEFFNIPSLVIAGKPGWQMNTILKQLYKNELKKYDIYFIHSPKNDELYWLYENCTAFFFPSIYEGFGLPILEAGYFKKPLYLSDIEIFREIGTELDGVNFIKNPENPLEWKNCFLSFLDLKKINSLKKEIKNQKLKKFNYKNSAREIINIIKKYEN